MTYIMIQNRGEFDPLGLQLLGASTKRDNDDQIGLFGSGFKYALAWLLRNGQPPRIFSGKTEIPITTEQVTFRGQTFKRMVIGGKPTSLTVDTGPRWQAADVFREVWSNALDEGGEELARYCPAAVGAAGYTRVFLQRTPEMLGVLDNWDRYFCDNLAVLAESSHGQILSPDTVGTATNVFVRGIWATDIPGRFRFTYNLASDKGYLNEERKLTNILFCKPLADLIRSIDTAPLLRCLFLGTPCFEWEILKYAFLPKKWAELLSSWDGRLYTNQLAQHLTEAERQEGVCVDQNAYALLTEKLGLKPASAGDREAREFTEESHPNLKRRVERLRSCLHKQGYASQAPIVFGRMRSPSILAFADRKRDRVCINSDYAARADDHELTACLLEEFLHLDRGFEDESREFQTYLLRELTSHIMES